MPGLVSNARPRPSTRPVGTVKSANSPVVRRLRWNLSEESTSMYWSKPTYELLRPNGSLRKKPR
jgi:hypothetical protein